MRCNARHPDLFPRMYWDTAPRAPECGSIPKVDEGVRQELERLRARAYGPAADIADDADAVERLRVLEHLERTERTAPVHRPPSDPEPLRADLPAAGDATPEPPADDDDEPAVSERPALLRSRRGVWAWAISLALVTALASAATTVGVSLVPVSTSVGASQVATLVEDPTAQTPALFGERRGDERAFADFYGVTAFVGSAQVDASDNRGSCLYLLDTDEVGRDETNGFRGNFVYGGCGAGIFPATVQFVVAEGMPDAFVERFPLGTSVQFVFDGENVGVFTDGG